MFDKRILIIADHASNYIPVECNNLGLSSDLINSHISFDIGIKELSSELSKKLDCCLIQSKYSRLLIDMNRDLLDPTLIPEIVDKKIISANMNLNKNIRRSRIVNIYKKYHSLINSTIKSEKINILISLHSFNPIFKGKKRNLKFGILSNKDKRLSKALIENFKKNKLCVGDNKPYNGNLIGDSMYRHGLRNNIIHVLIEIRNDLISSTQQVKNVSLTLSKLINKSLKHLI